jgi:thiol:disulfide interchange protein
MHAAAKSSLALKIVASLALGLLGGCNRTSGDSTAAVTPELPAHDLATGRVEFVEGYQRGLEHGRQQGKPMLVFFTAHWCDYCHAMAREAFSQQAVIDLSKKFTCVLVDADSEPEICRQFRVRGYPTVQFLSPGGLPLNRLVGKQPANQVVMEMEAVLQAVARRIDEPTTLR